MTVWLCVPTCFIQLVNFLKMYKAEGWRLLKCYEQSAIRQRGSEIECWTEKAAMHLSGIMKSSGGWEKGEKQGKNVDWGTVLVAKSKVLPLDLNEGFIFSFPFM